MSDNKQIRFCPNCGHQNRDDGFEINTARCNDNEGVDCPKCKTWLWSIIFERDFIEITDWDENSIHNTKEDLVKTLSKTLEIINEQ